MIYCRIDGATKGHYIEHTKPNRDGKTTGFFYFGGGLHPMGFFKGDPVKVLEKQIKGTKAFYGFITNNLVELDRKKDVLSVKLNDNYGTCFIDIYEYLKFKNIQVTKYTGDCDYPAMMLLGKFPLRWPDLLNLLIDKKVSLQAI